MKRTCGKHCEGLKGLKVHQRSCRIIQGLGENLMKDLDENSGGDMDESTFGDLVNNNCTLSASVFFSYYNEIKKKGVKSPSFTSQRWTIADDFFKAAFVNKPIGSTDLNDVVKEFNCVIYNYFKDSCWSVDNNDNRHLSAKYKENSTKDLKRILKALNRSGGDMEQIKVVSRELGHKLRNGNSGDINTTVNTNFDHDSAIGKSFWGYIMGFLTLKCKQFPSFTEARCIFFFRSTFA